VSRGGDGAWGAAGGCGAAGGGANVQAAADAVEM
jgi:hypothetical protein